MSLCKRPPYQKGSAKKKSKLPSSAQRARWGRLAELGCILNHMAITHDCYGRTTIHHCGTGGGSRKDHDQVVPLCSSMHTGPHGIDGRQSFSKRSWQEAYASEDAMLAAVAALESKTN